MSFHKALATSDTGVWRCQTTPDLITATLRREIQRGAPAPGGPLRQEDLATRFGVSRIPVREALRQLEAEGLVVVYPNRGAFVAHLTDADVEELYSLRVLLEGDLVERAVPRLTPDDLRHIERAARTAEQGVGRPEWRELDDAFHVTLYAPAQRPHELALVNMLRGTVARYHAAYQTLATQRGAWVRDHRAIVAAYVAGDTNAARNALESHIGRAGRFLLTKLSPAQKSAKPRRLQRVVSPGADAASKPATR